MPQKPSSTLPRVQSTSSRTKRPEPWNYFSSIEDYRKYKNILNNFLNSAPFGQSTLTTVKNLTEKSCTIQNIDIDHIKILLGELKKSLSIFDNSSKAATAYVNIKIAKLMIIVENKIEQDKLNLATEKEKTELAITIRNKIFTSNKKEKSTYYAHKKIAKIPNVESYCFLGMDKLRDISSLIDYKNEDPIGELFSQYNYKFDISAIEETEEFSLKLKTVINKEILKNNKLNPSYEAVQQYSKSNPKLTKSAVLKISQQINQNNTVDDVLYNQNNIPNLPKKENKAPLYNEFEEKCFQLMDIFESIIDDDYVPDFNPTDFKILLETLQDMNGDLYMFWQESWEGFDNER